MLKFMYFIVVNTLLAISNSFDDILLQILFDNKKIRFQLSQEPQK